MTVPACSKGEDQDYGNLISRSYEVTYILCLFLKLLWSKCDPDGTPSTEKTFLFSHRKVQ